MTILEILNTTVPVKLKLLTYGRDGNKVVVHYQSMNPITDNLYVYKTKPDDYGQYEYLLASLFPCGYAVVFGRISRWDEDRNTLFYQLTWDSTREELPLLDAVHRMSAFYQTNETFLRYMDGLAEQERHISKLHLRLAEEILRESADQGKAVLSRYLEARQSYLELREEKSRIAAEKRKQEDEERQRKRDEAWNARLIKAEQAFREDGTEVAADIDAIFELARRLEVNIPINVKGWMRRSLVAFTIQNGHMTSCRYKKTASKTIYIYIDRMVAAVRKESVCETSQNI